MSGVAPEAIALSLVLGVLLGLVFAAVEAVRALFSLGRIATAALDLLFALLAALSTFVLALAVARGSLRFFPGSVRDHRLFVRGTVADARRAPASAASCCTASPRVAAGRKAAETGRKNFSCGKRIHQTRK